MIEINNLTNFVVDKKYFVGVAKKVLKGENRERENLSIAFISEDEMRGVNKKYRKKEKPTDVLSFGKASHFKEEVLEVIICPQIVRKNITNSKVTLKKELASVLVHGILHTLGYDHETSRAEEEKMSKKQAWYLSKVT